MNDFEKKLVEGLEASILKHIASGDWVKVDYGQRISLSKADLDKIYAQISWTRIHERLAEKIEDRIVDATLNALATEVATDIKKIMCNTDLREDMRSIIREKIRDGVAAVADDRS